ncbi:hypothetical protein A2U01_0062198, partial [Trifolium medium]|nr:hypothetical protein [Trifolium medium]
EVERVGDVEVLCANRGDVLSDLSESSKELPLDVDISSKKRGSKHRPPNRARQPLQPLGAPLFQRLVRSVNTPGRRRKKEAFVAVEGSKNRSREEDLAVADSVQTLSSSPRAPAIDLQV